MTDDDRIDMEEAREILDTSDDITDVCIELDRALDEIEQLREELEYHGECARIAEQVIEGTRLEDEYQRRMREKGMYDD